jgi:hypothetical protein
MPFQPLRLPYSMHMKLALSEYLADEYWHGSWTRRGLIAAGLSEADLEQAMRSPHFCWCALWSCRSCGQMRHVHAMPRKVAWVSDEQRTPRGIFIVHDLQNGDHPIKNQGNDCVG